MSKDSEREGLQIFRLGCLRDLPDLNKHQPRHRQPHKFHQVLDLICPHCHFTSIQNNVVEYAKNMEIKLPLLYRNISMDMTVNNNIMYHNCSQIAV